MAQNETLQTLGTAHVEVAVLETRALVGIGIIFQGKRRHPRGTQELDLAGHELHLTRGNFRVDGFRGPLCQNSTHSQNILVSDMFGPFMGGAIHCRVKNHLNDPGPIAEVDKDQPSMITPAQDPAH